MLSVIYHNAHQCDCLTLAQNKIEIHKVDTAKSLKEDKAWQIGFQK